MANELKAGILANEPQRLLATESERLRGIVGGAEVSDVELLRGAGRDPDAFRDFYERYSEEILGYFTRRTADRDTALELTAETFSRVWVTRKRFEDRHEGSAAPWLYGIARNVLLMSIRRGAVERRTAAQLGVLERLDLDGRSDAAPEAGWADGADELLDSLPLSQQEALRLRIVDELTYDEVADALGTTRSAARVRVHRALTALRKRFSQPGGPTMTTDDPRLPLLGDALREAAADDLSRTDETGAAPALSGEARLRRRIHPKTRIGTRTVVAFVAAALTVPAAAIAMGVFSSEQKVADSIPAGNFSFAGTEPTCTTVREGQEYDCVLDQPPNGEVPPGSGRFVVKPGDWLGVVEPTADETRHVNGGCRSQNAQGTRWLCYLGKESVKQSILAPAALGEYLPSPAGP